MIIKKTPNASGAYSAPQTWVGDTPPVGYAVIADTVDMSDFYNHNGFVNLTVESIKHTKLVEQTVEDKIQTVEEVYIVDTMTSYMPNVEAWEAWKASLPEPVDPEPTMEDRVTALEEQLAESDAVALALYEAQVEQETMIAEHDEAILGIYEMIGR